MRLRLLLAAALVAAVTGCSRAPTAPTALSAPHAAAFEGAGVPPDTSQRGGGTLGSGY
jgi:hypothetical protein